MRHEHAPYQRPILAVVALVLALAVLPAGRADAEPVFTFEGGGFGHSVGMSQFGAYGMALDGYGWQEILTHYYTGTTVEQAEARFTDPPLWVGIVQERQRVEFLVRGIGEDPAPVTITRNTKTLTAQPGQTIVIEHLGDGRCRVSAPSGSLTGGCGMTLEWDGWEESPTTALQLAGCSLPDWNAPGGTVYKPCTYARGTMHVNPDNNTQTVDVSLEIDVEDYVLGISESPYGWGDSGGMAALQAQATAARSYAIHRAVDRGDPQSRPWCWCQIYDTPVDQNYVGWGHGTQTWIEAVRSTAGMVVTHPAETYDGDLLPIEAFYSSSTFGWTENSEHGFTAYVPYLRNVDDHWSLDPRVYNHSGRWTRQFSASSLASRLPGMSSVTGLEVTACSPSGAALEITFTGSGGPRAYTTRELRGHLGLRSMQILRAGSPLPGEPACPQPGAGGGGEPGEEGGPVVLAGFSFDDDSAGDSFGDNDGIAECGEVIEAFTTVRNEGAALDGVAATLLSDDPYVSVRWNNTSTFSNLPAGAEAANDGDWDLEIAAGAPRRHEAVLTMEVVAEGAGPWEIPVRIATRCGAPEAAATVGIGDLNGNGSPEIVTAVRTPRGRWHLKARDPETGDRVAAARIATPQWDVVELDPVPGAPTQVAALLDRGGRTRVVIVDLATGEKLRLKLGARGDSLGAAPVHLADGRTAISVLIAWGDGVRLKVSAADGTPISKRNLRIVPEDAEIHGLGDLDGDGTTEVVVVGRRFSGQTVAFVIDPNDGSHRSLAKFGSAPPSGAATLASDEEGPRDTIAVAQEAGSEAVITLADARTGDEIGRSTIPIAHPSQIEVLPSLGPAMAVLGTAADGSRVAVVTDPYRARILSGRAFDIGELPVDLTVLAPFGPSGAALAGLEVSGGSASIVLRDAISGASLGSIRVP